MNTDEIVSLRHQLEDLGVDEAIITALAQVGPSILTQLETASTSKWYWTNVVRVIRAIGYPANQSAIPLLIRLLQDVNWPGSVNAEDELIRIGNPVLPWVKKVMQQESSDHWWMSNIFRALERMPADQLQGMLPELLEFARDRERSDPEGDATASALSLLGHIASPHSEAAINVLVEIASDTERMTLERTAALNAVVRCSSESLRKRPGFLESLSCDETPEVRATARSLIDEPEP